tara:strand:- start:957 stop:1412 length:456 start_codon:yes stop_codon:yes gene_type:complete
MARFKMGDIIGVDLSPQELNFVIEYSKDFNARRAAVASGYEPDTGYQIKNKENVVAALAMILNGRLEASHIDAEWVLMEAVDNHMIARQCDNINASNTALKLIAQHTMVDAMASDKLNMNVQGDQQVMARLMRGRQRMNKSDDNDDEVSFF